MPDVDIEIHTNDVLNELARKSDEIGAELAALAEDYAKAQAPVRTGNLRDSIEGVTDENGNVTIGTDVEYAPIQEAIHHYLHDAIAMHEEEYKQIMENQLKEE